MAQIARGENSLRGVSGCIAILALCAVIPDLALSQGLPWQSSPQNPPPAQFQNPPSPPSPPPSFYSPSSHGAPASRDEDDRKLDLLASRFYAIHPKTDPDALRKLGALENKVADFRDSLGERRYDVSDIERDARRLEKRIRAQRRKWMKKSQSDPSMAKTVRPYASPAPAPHPPTMEAPPAPPAPSGGDTSPPSPDSTIVPASPAPPPPETR